MTNYRHPLRFLPFLFCLLLANPLAGFSQEGQEGEEAFCMACSREAWEGDSAALNKFIASCGIVDTVGYDSLDVVDNVKPVLQKVTMKLKSGKVLYTDSVYIVPDKMPEYQGGFSFLVQYIKDNIRYPAKARENKIEGTVILEFIVERDGTPKGVKVLRGIGYGCDEEAKRLIAGSNHWIPGKKGKSNVRVKMRIPVRFALR